MLLKNKDLPPAPRTALVLMERLLEEKIDLSGLTSILGQDPGLRDLVTKMSPASSQGDGQKDQGLKELLSAFPSEVLKETLVALSFTSHLLNGPIGRCIDVRSYCTHSIATAVIMREVSAMLGFKNSSEMFLLGLLHDFGRLVLDTLPGSNYGEVLNLQEQGLSLADAERRIYGWDSCETWMYVAKVWGFPAAVVKNYHGWTRGKVSIRTRKFAEAASGIADMLGCSLLGMSPLERSNLDFNLLAILDSDSFMDISEAVEKELLRYDESLKLNHYDSCEIYRTLLTSAHSLSRITFTSERIYKNLSMKIQDLEMLANVFTAVIKSLEGDPLTFSVLESVIEGYQLDGAFMINREMEGGYVGYSMRCDPSGEAMIDLVELQEDELPSCIQKCIESGRSIKVEKPSREKLLTDLLGEVAQAWLAPAFVKGNVISIMGVGVQDKVVRKGLDMGTILEILSAEIGLSVENTRLYRRLRREADTDSLTGISNRRNVMQILKSEFARFKRKGIPLTVAVFDVDNFKHINDTRGHLAGDEHLVNVADVLKKEIRESDYVGRYGGDEFIIIFPYTSIEESRGVVERILAALDILNQGIQGPDLEKKISMSAGLATAVDNMTRFDELINKADDALYEAKSDSRGAYVVYAE